MSKLNDTIEVKKKVAELMFRMKGVDVLPYLLNFHIRLKNGNYIDVRANSNGMYNLPREYYEDVSCCYDAGLHLHLDESKAVDEVETIISDTLSNSKIGYRDSSGKAIYKVCQIISGNLLVIDTKTV